MTFSELNQKISQIAETFLWDLLPGGVKNGNEYRALNPTRDDVNIGSFSINVETGVWSDFACNDRGGDFISLYGYINGLGNGDSFKKITADYFPGDRVPVLIPQQKNKQYLILTPVPPSAKNWQDEMVINQIKAVYEYKTLKNELLGYIVRTDDKKFYSVTYWFNKEKDSPEWRIKGFQDPRPLYRLEKLKKDEELIIVEGEKCADALGELGFNVITWPGGGNAVGKCNWEPITGFDSIVIWPDFDTAGTAAANSIEKIISKKNKSVRIIKIPAEYPDKWDCADAINSGWGRDEIEKFIAVPEIKKAANYFRILGMDSRQVFIWQNEINRLFIFKFSELAQKNLLFLAPLDYWTTIYPAKNGTVAWVNAVDDIATEATGKGFFDIRNIRGRGFFYNDKKEIIFNDGGGFIVDDIVYSSGPKIKYKPSIEKNFALEPLEKVFALLNYKNPEDHIRLMSWVMFAPFCGLFRWRPHIWLTGQAGSGKTWVLENIIGKILQAFAIRSSGSTSEAGIRQQIKNDTLPVIMDEFEAEDKFDLIRLQKIIELARMASSSSSSPIIKGSKDGEAVAFNIECPFMFSSINVNLKSESDKGRIFIVELKQVNNRKKFSDLKKEVKNLTPEYLEKMFNWVYSNIDLIKENFETLSDVIGEHNSSKRIGDNEGLFEAVYWTAKRQEKFKYEEVHKMHGQRGKISVGKDYLKLLEIIFDFLLENRVSGESITVGELVKKCFDLIPDRELHSTWKEVCRNHGVSISISKNFFAVSINNNVFRKKIMVGTQWEGNWDTVLMRIDGAEKKRVRFNKMGYGVCINAGTIEKLMEEF